MSYSQCRELITEAFPHIDHEISDYVNSILDDGHEDFESSDDLFDAIGVMLQQADETKTEDDIKEICDRLFSLLHQTSNGSGGAAINGHNKVLDAPLQMSKLAEEMVQPEDTSIWLVKRDNSSVVDQKKLEKADKMIQKKLDRREQSTLKKVESTPEMATASQQINKRDVKMESSGTNKSYDVKLENIDVSYGDKVLLTAADLHLVYGRRYGFTGRNGLGKTTLLKMLSSRSLMIPSHISVLHVEQEVAGDDTPAIQSVLECDEKREALLAEEKALNAKLSSSSPGQDNSLSTRIADVYKELEAIEADKAPARAAMILSGLGFSSKDQSRPTREFSGGWRMRLALARALFTKPDLLLLDEPTNMLDMKAIIWLENYLQNWPTTIFVVSHDRLFLDSVATDIIHLHSCKLDSYRGNYEVFHKTREERLKNQRKEYEAQKQYRDHIQVFIDRFRYNANRAAQVQSKLKLLEKLPELKPVEKESDVVLKFPECDKLSPPILQLDDVVFYYSKEKILFNKVCVNANMDSRICIVGDNGAGKTTLLKLLLGEMDPCSGHRHAHRNLRIGYFSQHHVDQLDLTLNSVQLLASRFPGSTSEVYRGKLGLFGVTGDLSLRPVSSLSGGQKSRVAFAVMSMTNPNFFILDEPTNHLDMETIEALGDALNKFQGGVILVSHDERLIRKICKELWVVSGGTVTSLDGGIDEYKKLVQAELDSN